MTTESTLIAFYVLVAALAVLVPCWVALRPRHPGIDDDRERY